MDRVDCEVIHAGLGYPAGSHKARLCVRAIAGEYVASLVA